MTHVSKNPVDKNTYFQILEGFIWLLSDLKSESDMKLFLNDFLTKTERIMLAKRLALALMITKGYETKIITQILHVSTGTVYRMREWVDRGGSGLTLALKRLIIQEKLASFWKKVDNFIEDNFMKMRMFPKVRSQD